MKLVMTMAVGLAIGLLAQGYAQGMERTVALPYQYGSGGIQGNTVSVPKCKANQYVGVSGSVFVCKDAPIPTGHCSISGLGTNYGLSSQYKRSVNGQDYYVYPFAMIQNEAVTDWGKSNVDDSVMIYCVATDKESKDGGIAVCLTREDCPWR